MEEIDFAKLGYDECYMNLYTTISEVCAQDKTRGGIIIRTIRWRGGAVWG
jgi:hypothetical protein